VFEHFSSAEEEPREGILDAYVDTSPPEEGEFRRLRTRMCEAIEGAFTEDEWLDIRSRLGTEFRKPGERGGTVLVSQPDLEFILDRGVDRISLYENDAAKVPDHLIRLLRIITEEVESSPAPARRALEQYTERNQS